MSIISDYRNAAFPAIAVASAEESRLTHFILDDIEAACAAGAADRDEEPPDVFLVSAIGGIRDLRTGAVVDAGAQFAKAFAFLAGQENAVLIVHDFQHIIHNAPAYRALKESFGAAKANGSMIILVAPSWRLPPELEHDLPVLSFPLPSRGELRAALDLCVDSAQLDVGDSAERLLDAASGLTLQEAENSFALAFATVADLPSVARRVLDEKMKIVKQSGFAEVAPPARLDDVGGLGAFKGYLATEVVPAKDDELLRVRGILLVGVPGTGKSLASRAIGSILQWPVLRGDIGALKGSLVGQSESNMRGFLKLADAVSPCVMWLDEIEKGVAGYASSGATDSGVTIGMIGALLTWMQEHTSAVIVVATCNDYAKLPAEMTRAGRFDERFFVDLPTYSEREEIADVHLRRFTCAPDGLLACIAGLSDAWTGAEIEQLVKSAARQTRRHITREALMACAQDIKPISRVRAREIDELRAWARDALRSANTPAPQPTPTIRQIRGRKAGGTNA